jgi:hypothetical protein
MRKNEGAPAKVSGRGSTIKARKLTGGPLFKANSFSVLALTVLYSVSFSWGADFRCNDWGAAPYEVVAFEGMGTIWETRPPGWGRKTYVSSINYYGVHLGVEAGYGFLFTTEEKLGLCFCFPCVDGIDPFFVWEKTLSASYGEPANCDDVLTDDDVVLARYYYGDAAAVEEGILNGYFALVRYWETETTDI